MESGVFHLPKETRHGCFDNCLYFNRSVIRTDYVKVEVLTGSKCMAPLDLFTDTQNESKLFAYSNY